MNDAADCLITLAQYNLYVLGSGDQANPIPDKLRFLQAGGEFQLYRILREPPE